MASNDLIGVLLAAINRTRDDCWFEVVDEAGQSNNWEPVSRRQRLRDISSVTRPRVAGRCCIPAALGDRPISFPTPHRRPHHPELPLPGRLAHCYHVRS